jgi:hypothetical protein
MICFRTSGGPEKPTTRKCNYRIRSIDSTKYQGFMLDWNTDSTWLRVFEPKSGSGTITANPSEVTNNDDSGEEAKPATIFGGKCMISLDEFT